MNKINYQRELDQILAEITAKGEVPTLLLHSCCAPCSSYVLSYLASYFRITLYYYNPNISPKEEYQKRVQEQMRLIRELPVRYPIRSVFLRWRKGWKIYRRAESAALAVMN